MQDDLTGRHFSWPLFESWVSLRGHAHYEQATVIYTAEVLYDNEDDYWWVYLWTEEATDHHYRLARMSGTRIRPWITEYERLNP